MRPPTPTDETIPKEHRATLGVAFVTLFLDLIGFSIIFPLFPSMLQHYLATEGDSGLFGLLHGALLQLSSVAGAADPEWGIIVLFGGILGSVYSLLQFACAPLFGALSDRIGRRPVVLVSLTGLALSYVLWLFAGNFALLVAARFIGGIMSANISTASAIVADVTTPKTRSKGMALIGVAFGIGFILGPALGGITSMVDLTQHFPGLVPWGINPYSMPAFVALVLTLLNLAQAYFRLPETLKPEARGSVHRTMNPLRLFRTEHYPGVTATNLAYFLFIAAFSGMEFSLTFLATDRLGYGPGQNAMMFLFVGVILSLMQGGYVHRMGTRISPRSMTLHGLTMLVPGLAIIGIAGAARSAALLYVGLFLLAAGSAQATPCLTALASLYAPAEDQGRILGVFRSLGALARAMGPLIACVAYWRLGSTTTYLVGAASLLIPILLTRGLPPVPVHPDRAPATP
jgi:MFS family permease